ncbi:MAG: phosphatidate cytidylyltransferase [Acidimicrobiales bacterium]
MDERPPWDRPDEDDDDAATDDVPPTEGVRIIGAEEAAEAVERGSGAPSRRAEGMPRYGDRPESPPEGPRPTLRFPLGAADDAGGVVRPRVSGSPSPALPHWTDPPTGEVPRILPDDDTGGTVGAGEDVDAWSGLGAGPRWRDAAPGGWDDHDEGRGGLVHDEETRIGALDDRDRPAPDDFFAFEDINDISEPAAAAPDPEDEWFDAEPEPVGARRRPLAADQRAPEHRQRPRPRRPAPSTGGRPGDQELTERDLPTAVGVGVGLGVAAIVTMTLGPAFGVALVALIVTFCAAELFGALQKAAYQPATLLGLVATAATVLSAYWKGEIALPLVISLTVVFTLLWYLVGVTRIAPTTNAGLTILVVTYVGLFGSFAALMLRLPNGTGILLGTVVVVVANDVGALFAGRRFGRTLLAADISPNKTVEGAIGGAVAAVVASYVVLDLIGLHPWQAKGGSAVALGLLVAVLAPVGDLVESMVKRDLEIKDMGSMLPGHGGLIDRFDSLLFVLPAAYYLARLLEIA